MTIEIRLDTSEQLAGAVVDGDRAFRFVGWLGLMRALSQLIPEPRRPRTPPGPSRSGARLGTCRSGEDR